MSHALLLVDLQQDFINRPGLSPPLADITTPLASVLAYARGKGIPVLHVRTRVTTSPDNRMPHWQRQDIRECVKGTPGEATPAPFAAEAGERVFYKQFFSGFGSPNLDTCLRELGITEIWVAGLYTHSCVRATVMDAYERGYRVSLLRDCTASNDPLHAQITLDYLNGRAAQLATCTGFTGAAPEVEHHYQPGAPGKIAVSQQRTDALEIATVTTRAATAAAAWAAVPATERRNMLERFSRALDASQAQLGRAIVTDIGKPLRAAEDELQRAIGHVREAASLASQQAIDDATQVLYEPHGAVAIVTPWNNPAAIALGKIAAALVLGNTVVWKPALPGKNIAHTLLQMLRASGVPDDVLQIVHGGAQEVALLAATPAIAAVSITGPEQAGQAVNAICQPRGKPLQAELGGNNALLVLADAEIEKNAASWAQLAFAFAGQRCTAIRRFVVEAAALPRFEQAMIAAMAALEQEPPESRACTVGPMISAAACTRATKLVAQARSRGARVVSACNWQLEPEQGHYFPPMLLADLPGDDPLIQEESFAPIAVVQCVNNFEQGLAQVNSVRQGLLAAIATTSQAQRERFIRDCAVGIVIDGAGLPLHPAAPFGGRKVSQIGPPEHGVWDREFFTRPKVYYSMEQP